MSNLAVRHDDTTFEEFLDLIEDGQKADLIDGVIYMASPDNTDAADLQVWLSHILGLFVEVRDLGKIYLSGHPGCGHTMCCGSCASCNACRP
jgi:Uma2 family endonuclease